MKYSRRGFTLLELVIAAGLTSLIILAGTTLFINSQKAQQTLQQSSNLSWNTMGVVRSLGVLMRGAGGASVRPWNAVQIEDDCAAWVALNLPSCGGSDRITIAVEKTMLSGGYYPKISVANYNSGTQIVTIIAPDINGSGTIDGSECVLDGTMDDATIILVNAPDTITRVLRVNSVDVSTCQLTVEPEIQGTPLNQGAIGGETFPNGTVSLVSLKTIYRDPTSNTLYRVTKIMNDNTLAQQDRQFYHDNVYDLQFALGYDVGFRNQTITMNGSATDEVFYNHINDLMTTLGGVGGTKTDLKMLYVGVVLGTSQYRKSALGNTVTLLNGSPKTDSNLYLFGVERRFYLRNVLDFL